MMRNGASVVLHTGWRGVFQGATNTSGSAVFTDVPWPGGAWRVNLKWTDARTNHSWVGSLPMGQNDHSGLQYRRNRYYDPSSGQFTQQDPIGIAGGLNLYGYANGDPVNYSDPFGLSPCLAGPIAMRICAFAALTVGSALGAGLGQLYVNATSGDGGLFEGVGLATLEGARDGAAAALIGEGMAAVAGASAAQASTVGFRGWSLGGHKSASQWASQMERRGWSNAQISEAINGGESFTATNLVNPSNNATRFVHPTTGRSVVIDDVTEEILHIGGEGFRY